MKPFRRAKQVIAAVVGGTMVVATNESFAVSTPEMTIFGHKAAVTRPSSEDGIEERLVIDGRTLVEDAFISIDSIDDVGGVGVLVGTSSSGGSDTCGDAPFIVSLVKGGEAKVSRPSDDCTAYDVDIGAVAVSIVAPAFPYKLGHRYKWTPSGGLKDEGKFEFKPDSQSDWDTLERQHVKLPLDLYKNQEVNAAITSLTRSDDRTFASNLEGLSSGKFFGDVYVGSGCIKVDCSSTGSFIAADRANKKVYLAWKEDGKPFVVRPPVNGWPSQIRRQLKDWTKELQ